MPKGSVYNALPTSHLESPPSPCNANRMRSHTLPPLQYVSATQHASFAHGSIYYSQEEFADFTNSMALNTNTFDYNLTDWTSDLILPAMLPQSSTPPSMYHDRSPFSSSPVSALESPIESMRSSPISSVDSQLGALSSSSLAQALVDYTDCRNVRPALNCPPFYSSGSSSSGSSHSPSPPPASICIAKPISSGKSGKGSNTSKKCSHCGATSTPLWRRDPTTLAPLCNACGLYLQTRNKNRPQKLIDADNAEEPTNEELLAANWDGKSCAHCLTRCTSVWRRSKEGQPLCNACGVYLRLRGKERPLELRKNKFRPRQKHNTTNGD